MRKAFPQREFHFSKIAPHLGDRKIKRYITEKIKALASLRSLEIYVKIINLNNRNEKPDFTIESIDLFAEYMTKEYYKFFDGTVSVVFNPDQGYFPKTCKYLRILDEYDAEDLLFHVLQRKTHSSKGPCIHIPLDHADSKLCKGVQLADIVSGSIFQKYQRGNPEFYNLWKPKIKYIKEV